MFLFAPSAFAGIHFGSDATIAGWWPFEFDVRTHNYLFLTHRGAALGIGPVFNYERPHPYMREFVYGGGIRWGENYFVELDAGYIEREFDGTSAHGYMAALIIGRHLGRFFRISIPIQVRRISSGVGSKSDSVDFFPYIGLGIGL